MSLNTVKLLGISITTNSQKEILEEVRKCLVKNSELRIQKAELRRKPFVIVTPNPEQIALAQKDSHFAKLLNQADVAVPDGIGISLAAKFLRTQNSELNDQKKLQKIAGVELMENLVALAAKEGAPVGLIGGRAGLAVRAFECLKAKYPKLGGWAEDGPEVRTQNSRPKADQPLAEEFRIQNEDVDGYFKRLVQKIQETDTRVVFVGLGAPKQEYFIDALARQVQSSKFKVQSVLMSVGGSFDEISGRLPRAPRWLDELGLKWLWRLVLEPWRWKRQLALVEFIWLVLHERLSR